MGKGERIGVQTLDQIYYALMPETPEERTDAAAAKVYALIKGYEDFMNLEAAINFYSAATERRGFQEGFMAGLGICMERMIKREEGGPEGPIRN